MRTGRTVRKTAPEPKQLTHPKSTAAASERAPEKESFPVVGVGASAGGLEAFTQLIRALPANAGIALVLVQHLDPKRESMLVSILSRETKMPVLEVKSGMVPEADHVYIPPPYADLAIAGGVFNLLPRTDVGGRHLPIDSFFRSLAEDQGTCAIGVILSGTASDGVEGMKAIKAAGGITFAQEPQSAKYDGMPRNAIESGAVDSVLPPEDIAQELTKIGRNPHAAFYRAAKEAEVLPAGGDGLQKVFAILRRTTGIDFSAYKPGTIKRRIARRMVVHKIEKLKQFVEYLQQNPTEVQALCQDLLIPVTSFFREPETCEALTSQVFPRIVRARTRDAPLRLWVPGCATGEEAFSIAICLLEFLGDRDIPVQIFATDVNEAAIEKARAGRYPPTIEANVSPERLKRFFVKLKDGYRIGEPVRKSCVFAKHDLLRDPPFSNLDLIVCSNVLIYLGPMAQERVIKWFHYALKLTGFLVLGKSEAISRYQELFVLTDRTHRIYSRQPLSQRLHYDLAVRDKERQETPPARSESGSVTPQRLDLDKEAERIILSRYGPAGFIVNEKLQILKLRGRTRPYLDPSPGEPSLNLLKMVRPDLVSEVRAAIHKATKEHSAVRKHGISLRLNGRSKEIDLQVIPIGGAASVERCFLVLFEDLKPPAKRLLTEMKRGGATAVKGGAGVDRRSVLQWKRELAATKRSLRSVIEEAEAANEELQSAGEELESRNEELQSANEELETAKEELQSANEEMTTLNETLRNQNEELSKLNSELVRARAYSESIVNTVRESLLVLDSELRVRTANPAFYKTFLTTPEGTLGRPVYELGNRQWNIPGLRTMLEKISSSDGQFQDVELHWQFEGIGPRQLILDARLMEGWQAEERLVLLAIVDATDSRRAQEALKQGTELARSNEDLRQFAHAAAHDLQEPLRMVISYMQMISERYKGKLDSDGDEYIGYAVDGAKRMQQLIDDLLAYAEIGSEGKELVPTDCATILDEVRANLDVAIRESAAAIESDPLPTIVADPTEMSQLFQNLIGNAIKFHGPEPPRIQIAAKPDGPVWAFSVSDNGIGIEREHQERIFSMFQRLHDKVRYPGTGIGLTICKKIIDRMGGRIWVESELGKGSTFHFTVPATA
ncbi:MAG TPA: chemotaxis protein CheB, partial [Candidatus Binatia bacterium]|nr:chemotaxis protein CheB [Candidatus Binatia bacterium]